MASDAERERVKEVPFNIVTPAQREALVAIVVKIGAPSKDNVGKDAIPAYKAWLESGGNTPSGTRTGRTG